MLKCLNFLFCDVYVWLQTINCRNTFNNLVHRLYKRKYTYIAAVIYLHFATQKDNIYTLKEDHGSATLTSTLLLRPKIKFHIWEMNVEINHILFLFTCDCSNEMVCIIQYWYSLQAHRWNRFTWKLHQFIYVIRIQFSSMIYHLIIILYFTFQYFN